jgi:hypothetical protein
LQRATWESSLPWPAGCVGATLAHPVARDDLSQTL